MLRGTKVCIHVIGSGHMTMTAAIPIYGKTSSKFFFSRTRSQMTLKHGTQQKGLKPYKVCLNLGLTLI